jgi:hypothetical protein
MCAPLSLSHTHTHIPMLRVGAWQVVEAARDDVIEAHPVDVAGCDNLQALHTLTEATILHTLRTRAHKHAAYVRTPKEKER